MSAPPLAEGFSPLAPPRTPTPAHILFPAMPWWRWEVHRTFNLRLRPGETLVLFDRAAAGWLYYVMVVVDNPDVRLVLEVHAAGAAGLDVSPRDLHEYGAVGTNPGVITLYRYDPDSNVYVMGYSPQAGGYGVPFRGRVRALVRNPTPREATVKNVEAWLIMLQQYAL